MGIEPTTFHGIYINSLSCSDVNRHLTGTVTFESDFLKPNGVVKFTDVFMMEALT